MTPGEILEKHKTGQKYAHLLKGFSAFPLLRDGRGAVLSMPPIINSEATRCKRETTQCFVDVTGLSNRTVERTLNVLVTSLMEVMPELVVEAVRIVAGIPLNLEGKPGPQAIKVLEFLEKLRGVVDIEVVTQDERFSTAASERTLRQARVKRKKRKKIIDKVAASHILQTYLDRESNRKKVEG